MSKRRGDLLQRESALERGRAVVLSDPLEIGKGAGDSVAVSNVGGTLKF